LGWGLGLPADQADLIAATRGWGCSSAVRPVVTRGRGDRAMTSPELPRAATASSRT
jgi:hypothetical protein